MILFSFIYRVQFCVFLFFPFLILIQSHVKQKGAIKKLGKNVRKVKKRVDRKPTILVGKIRDRPGGKRYDIVHLNNIRKK
jgi:hypothetical protein